MLGGILTLAEFNDLVTGVPYTILDVETTGLHPRKDDLLGIAVSTLKGEGYLPVEQYITLDDPIPQPGVDKAGLAEVLRRAFRVPYMNYNLGFDLHFLTRLAGTTPDTVIDPMIGLWMLHEEGALALKDTASTLLGEELPDFGDLLRETQERLDAQIDSQRELYAQELKRAGIPLKDGRPKAKALFPRRLATARDIPIENLAEYATKDPVLTGWLWFNVIRPQLAKEGLLHNFTTYEMPYLICLSEMERAGCRVDEGKLQQKLQEMDARKAQVEAVIYREAGHEFNINASAALAKVLFEEMKFQPSGRKSKISKADSLDKYAFAQLADTYSSAPIWKALIEWKRLAKDRSQIVGLLKQIVDGKVYTRWNQCGTVTGRLSSSDPNLQNQKRPEKGEADHSIRAAFVADPGNTMVVADYSQIELRIIAHLTEDPLMMEVYRDPTRDLHAETASRLGVPRPVGKQTNFLTAYGGGPKLLREKLLFENGIDRSVKECAATLAGFYETYTGINPWKEAVIGQGRRDGYVETILGHRRHLPDLLSDDYNEVSGAERQAVNTPVQGSAADIIKVAMIRLRPILPQYGATMHLQVHDELVFDAPVQSAADFQRVLKEVMENETFRLSVPIVAEVGTGPSWGEAKG